MSTHQQTELVGFNMDQNICRKTAIASNTVTIHSGNIIYKVLKTSQEICASFCKTTEEWLKNKITLDENDDVLISNEEIPNNFENRKELKISVKLFLYDSNPNTLECAIEKCIKTLGCGYLDVVLLSINFPIGDQKGQYHSIHFKDIEAVWLKLENIVENKKINTIGICDFNAESLKELYQSAKVKPVTNQLNLTDCCTVPKDLLQFAEQNNINLFTHNDPKEILTNDMAQTIMSCASVERNWTVQYLAKYTSVLQLREIIQSKGYILNLK